MKNQNLPHFTSDDQLPLTLHAADIAGYLGISISAAYQLMRSKSFPVKKLGKRSFISREHFLEWVKNTTGQII